jgi:hypothetical protein
MNVKMCVIEEENGNLVVISVRGFTPSGCIGIVPNTIIKADYPYIVKIPIYDEIDTALVVGYTFEVDQVAADADPDYGQNVGV